MAVNPPLTSGAQGLERALQQFETAAQRVASAGVDGRPLATGAEPSAQPAPAGAETGLTEQADALVSLKLYAREVQASAKVIETADEMIGFLLDTEA